MSLADDDIGGSGSGIGMGGGDVSKSAVLREVLDGLGSSPGVGAALRKGMSPGEGSSADLLYE